MRPSTLLTSVSFAAILAGSLAGCALGPDFQRPAAPEVSAYTEGGQPVDTATADNPHGLKQEINYGADIQAEWWTVFQSDALNALIKQAIAANPDLEAAQASLRQAQEDEAAGSAVLFPEITGEFDTARQKTVGASAGGKFPGSLYTLHTAKVNVSYGVDLWGASRRQVEELEANTDYQRFQLEAAYLSLTSNVVTTAITEASLRGQITATQNILDQEDKQIALTQKQLDIGAINKAPLLSLRATREQTAASLPVLQKQLAQTRHQLAVLIGKTPSEGPLVQFELANLKLPQKLPLTLPSQLVEQRPDIRAAEANLHAASAAIGVAMAARLPQLNISADLGNQSNNLGQLLGSGTGIWSAGFSLVQPLFDAGKLEHKQGSAEAAFDVAAAQYRKTVLTSFQNVADVLRALQSDADGLRAQAEADKAARDALDLTTLQYKSGSASYLEVLNAEQTAQKAKVSLVQAEAQRFTDTAALFQALGGGWQNRTQDIAVRAKADDHKTDDVKAPTEPQAAPDTTANARNFNQDSKDGSKKDGD